MCTPTWSGCTIPVACLQTLPDSSSAMASPSPHLPLLMPDSSRISCSLQITSNCCFVFSATFTNSQQKDRNDRNVVFIFWRKAHPTLFWIWPRKERPRNRRRGRWRRREQKDGHWKEWRRKQSPPALVPEIPRVRGRG